MIHETITGSVELGRVVRLSRKARGLSQRALAEQSGCSQRFISELERGKQTSEVGKAIHVLSVLGVTLYAETSDERASAGEAVEAVTRRVAKQLTAEKRRVSLSDYL